jgi:putative PEP-CTERM system integral membrane protein
MNKNNLTLGVFWGWHIIYIILAVMIFLPSLVVPMFDMAWKGFFPWHYTIYTAIIVILPFVSVVLGATVFRNKYVYLLKYFYGFEMPLLFFLLIRVITFRDFNAAVFWLNCNVIIALTTWLVFVWRQNQAKTSSLAFKNSYIALSASTIQAMLVLYLGTVFMIIMLPIIGDIILDAIMPILYKDLLSITFLLLNPSFYLLLLFILFTSTLLIALPIVMVWFYLGQFILRFRYIVTTKRILAAMTIILAVISVNVTGFIYLNQQSQQQIFALLDEKMANPEHEAELLDKAEAIRTGLLNSYLARYRYVSAEGSSRGIAGKYQEVFNLDRSLAQTLENILHILAKPFLYDGKNWDDKEKAEKLYEKFFDSPIQKAERESILKAIKSTWEFEGNEAGLLHAANKYVHLKQQMIQVNQHQGVATVKVTQTLENITYQRQEVVIHFSLPEDSVVTGLWLSDDQSNLQKYQYVVAPKGAAQAVYKAEVKRRVDPALLEKTGPHQYRMRIYPIPAKSTATGKADPLFMQFEYQSLGKADGSWAVPQLLEKRNIFWDENTERSINGVVVSEEIVDWLPLAETNRAEANNSWIFSQDNKLIQAIPRRHNEEKILLSKPIAVLVDGSYSMTSNKQVVFSMFQQLEQMGIEFKGYFCRRDCQSLTQYLDINQFNFYGNSQTQDHIAAFMKVANPLDYSAIFILTDQGSYELAAKNDADTLSSTIPFWLVHLNGKLPYAYDDKVLDLIYRSKGGVSQSIKEALMRLQPTEIKRAAGVDADVKLLSISDRFIWVEQEISDENIKHNPALAKVVAAHQINNLISSMDLNKLDNLDYIHAIAKEQGIVSHYSSMLVLVNQRQKQALKKAENAKDRFEREVETGKLNPLSNPLLAPSVPEPEEWVLIIIVGLMLLFAMLRRKGIINGYK